MWDKYNIMHFHGVTNRFLICNYTGSILSNQVFHSQTTALCEIGLIFGGGGMMGKKYLSWIFLLQNVVPQIQGTVDVRYVHNQHKMIIECLYFLFFVIFTYKYWSNQLASETYACDFILSVYHGRLSSMQIFYSKSCIVKMN